MTQLLQLCINGLALGSVYTLVALAFILISESTGVVNFATGQFVMLGCFFGIGSVMQLHLPLVPGYAVALLAMAGFGALFNFFVYQPLVDRPVVSVIVATVAIGIVMQNVALGVWGSLPVRPPALAGNGQVAILGATIPLQALVTVVVAAALVGLVHLALYHSAFGERLRAVAQDSEAARLMAIPVRRMLLASWIAAAVLTGVAGLLLGPLWFADVGMGDPIALKAFAAAIIGGFGSIPGALVGGIAVGLAEILGAAYVTSTYKDALVFLIMMLFLLLRPEGIFASRISQRG